METCVGEKTLHLLRHAKSSWSDPTQEDFDRPLNRRGESAARQVATYLAGLAFAPDLVLCSPARRTKDTLALTRPALPDTVEVVYEPRIYEASMDTLLGLLHGIGEAVASALILGHNPGLERLAVWLADKPMQGQAARMTEKFPTAALASFAIGAGAWRAVGQGQGSLLRFVAPKDLG